MSSQGGYLCFNIYKREIQMPKLPPIDKRWINPPSASGAGVNELPN